MILYTSISGFVNGAIVIIFGLLVLLHNPKNKVNKLMALLCLSVAVWAISWGFAALAREKTLALFLNKMLDFGAAFIPILFLHWILVLLGIEKNNKNKVVLILGYLLSAFFAISIFTSYFVSVKPKPYFFYYADPGILHPFYLILCYFGLTAYALYNLLKWYKQTSGYKRAQIKYVLTGALLGFGGGATNYFLFYNIPIPPIGNPLVAVGFGFFTYAIIRYRLMDIKVVLGRGVAYILSAITIIGSASLLIYFNTQLTNPLSIYVLAPFIAILSILLLQVHRFYEKLAEQYFYRSFYETKIAISDLKERLRQVLELRILASLMLNTLTNIYSLNKIAVITKNTKNKEYTIQDSINFNKNELSSLIKSDEFMYCLKKKKRNTIRKNSQYLKDLGIEMLLPLVFEKEVIGIIILGSKKSGDDFSTHDLKLLEGLSHQASIALKNASLFAEINKRREELENFYKLTVEKEIKMLKLKERIGKFEEEVKKNMDK